MGFLKKIFGDAVDDLKQSLEDSKKEMLNSLSESKAVDDDDDDEPRINMGKLEDGILTISESFSELDDESLEDYKRLRKIVFPASLKKLDSDVICDQEKLEIVDFSKVTHLKEIPDDFISGETRIKEFVIPQGVTEVGDGFLGECGAGTKVFVPASVRKLGYINGNSNNDQYVYLFASHIDISDVEEDIKTLYVLSDYYGYYAKQLKECDSEARLREMPAEMMGVSGANEPEQVSATMQTSEPEPHNKIQSGDISTQNNELRDFKRKKMNDLREARDEKDRNRTPDNFNKWKKVVADIEVIDTALKAGATTFGELKELAKDNASIIAEIDEIQSSQLKAKQKQKPQKKKEPRKVRVSFNINGDEGFTRITMYPLIGKACQQTLKNGVERDRRTGTMEVSQDCIDKLTELLTKKDEQLPLEFLFAPVCTPTDLIVTDEGSDEEIYNDEYEIDPRYGIMSMDEAVDNYEDEEEDLKKYKEYLTVTAYTPDDNYISIGIAKTWDKLKESYIEGEGFVPTVIGETLKIVSEDDIALLHGETGLSDSTINFIMEIEDEFDPDKLDFINFDAEYGDVSSVLQETLAADYVSMNAVMYDGKMYFAQPQNMDLGENEGDDYYDIVNHNLEGDQEIEIEPEPKQESKPEPVAVVAPAPAPSAFSGLFSPRMEALINSAIQDGVLTEQEKAILKKRAEKDGEDWDEVEMIINSRLPRQEQVSPKKAVELSDIKRAHLFLSFKSYEGDDYAYLFLIDDNQFYATDENLNTPEIPSSDYFEDLDDYDCWTENLSDEYQSFKQLSESLVNDFVEARLDEYDGDSSVLAINNKYTVTIFVDKEKVYEETITCR